MNFDFCFYSTTVSFILVTSTSLSVTMNVGQYRKPLATFGKDTLEENVFKNSPKRWSQYIKAFLYSTHQKSMKNCLNQSLKAGPSFLVQNFEQNVIRCKSLFLLAEKPKIYKYTSRFTLMDSSETIVGYTQTRPTWSLVYPKDDLQEHTFYYVYLAPGLEINVTFNKVYFPETVTKLCDQAKMLICEDYKYFWAVDNKRNVMVRKLEYYEDIMFPDNEVQESCYKFCGIYSSGNFYPLWERIQFLFYGGSTSFVDLFFTVIDQSGMDIFTHEYYDDEKDLSPEWKILFPQKQLYLEIYFLSVNKFQIISLNIKPGEHWWSHVYDGPSALSPHLSQNHHTKLYQTTSFHCSIHTFIPQAYFEKKKQQDREKAYIKFDAIFPQKWRKATNILVSENETLKIAFGSTNCSHLCQLRIACDSSLFLNISVQNVIPTPLLSADCRFSGVTFYDAVNGTLEEDSTFCGTQWITDKSWKFKNIFSSTNSLFVVNYRQQNLGSNTVIHFTVSCTHCKLLRIDICFLGKDTDLFTKLFEPHKPGHMSFSLLKEKCLNLWIEKPNILKKMIGCLIFLRAGDIGIPGMKVEYDIKGFFPPPVFGMLASQPIFCHFVGNILTCVPKVELWSKGSAKCCAFTRHSPVHCFTKIVPFLRTQYYSGLYHNWILLQTKHIISSHCVTWSQHQWESSLMLRLSVLSML